MAIHGDGTPARWPGSTGLLIAQVGYQLKLFYRVPAAMFFTLALPLVMLILLNAVFGSDSVGMGDGAQVWPQRQFYTAGLAVFAAVTATYTNLANMIPIRRDEGVLKRWRSTPLPTWIYVGGAIGSSVILAAINVIVMLTLGVVAYGLEIDAAKVPAAIVTLIVGIASFAALGMAIAAVVPTASAASAVANATVLPLAFVSNVFLSVDGAPRWVQLLGDAFPLKAFAGAFQDAFNPTVVGAAWSPGRLGFIAVWGVLGAVVAVTRFRWEPSGSGGRRSRRRASNSES
jgi:ABC-2 type transport system permease protein